MRVSRSRDRKSYPCRFEQQCPCCRGGSGTEIAVAPVGIPYHRRKFSSDFVSMDPMEDRIALVPEVPVRIDRDQASGSVHCFRTGLAE